MADGPNHQLNFERGILNATHNLKEITAYLRFHSAADNYKTYLEMYVPKLEGTDVYEEFKSALDELNKPVEEVEESKKEEPKKKVADKEETENTKLTEEEFRALPADEQKELVKDLVKEDGDDSNTDKRVALYLS